MHIQLSETYTYLQSWIEHLPKQFTNEGKVIYDERNQIRVLTTPDGLNVCVKRYRKPRWLNACIYSYLRLPKAVRAYHNAQRLQTLGVATPEAIGYILCGKGWLTESYLVTRQSTKTHTFYEFRDGNVAGKEDLIAAFAQWVAHMHDKGVLHLDLSPGNILYDKTDDAWQFEVVDINRMRFGTVSSREGCYNLCRLWGKHDFFDILATSYATARNMDKDQCLKWIDKARLRFWKHRSHEHFVTDDSFSIGVIVSTYNNPKWLERVLWSLSCQTHPADEIIVADDGSTPETEQMLAQYTHLLPIKHVWHDDNGFRKTTILNQAVLAAESEYLIFIDQDLIARRDFISQHYRHARPNRFISGGAVLLPETLSNTITQDDICSQRVFDIHWLCAHGMPWRWKMSKLWKSPVACYIMNRLTTTRASWNGGNASTWKKYIIQANGFDTRMRYGAEDREFGQRLENAGIKGYQLRYGTPLLHLFHTRPYRNETDWQANLKIWKYTQQHKLTTTLYGIYKHQH